MPVYEYVCRSCGHRLQELQKAGDGPPGVCPECGGALRRAYGRVGVRFSGWGFSSTDRLLPQNRRGQSFAALQEKAEEIRDSG